jgi:uncharacterized protein YbcI
MHELQLERQSPLLGVSTAMVRLHKEHFGRGPTKARAHFAGPDMLVCAMSDALLPAERKMTQLGLQEQVRHSRISFQAAVQVEFVTAIEEIVHRKVTAFASAVDPDNNMVFENFYFEPRSSSDGADGNARDGAHGSGRDGADGSVRDGAHGSVRDGAHGSVREGAP